MTDWQDAPHWRAIIEQNAHKAVTGPGVAVYNNGYLLSSMRNSPQSKCAAFLQAYKCGWFYKAESKISADIAGLAISVSPENETGDNTAEVIEPDLSTPWEQLDPVGQFLRLMERPNPDQTGRQLRQKTQIRLDMAGTAFWYLEGGDFGLPTAIYGISPARMWPSYNPSGRLIGWVMDKDRQGGGVPFSVDEILVFSYASADDDIFGVGVVEAVYAELPLTNLMTKHTADVLTTGGRLAGMMWPKERSLGEDEYKDALRAWRSVASDPDAAKRLLVFPEPMEYAAGASTPIEIGIPELASLNRDNILTAFPISPYQLGVPVPGGLNSGATRVEDRTDYWEGTIHPRVEIFEEVIQTDLIPRYEAVVGYTLDFDMEEPNLDNATRLIEKAGALAALTAEGFDEAEAIAAVGLDHIAFVGKPAPPPQLVVGVTDSSGKPREAVTEPLVSPNPAPQLAAGKSSRAERDAHGVLVPAADAASANLGQFFIGQRDRTITKLQADLRRAKDKSAKAAVLKANPPTWWDRDAEDAALTATLRSTYQQVGRGALQSVIDNIGHGIATLAQKHPGIVADLLKFGGGRISDINDKTLGALIQTLSVGAERGYSIPQLIEGVPAENFPGVSGVTLDNGTPAFSDARAETIARTETMLSYNRANVQGYAAFGVETLLAYDGDGDEECADRDGQEFSIEEALDIEDHPNGTLVWSPVVDKAKHDEGPNPLLILAEAMKAPQPVNVTVQTPEPPDFLGAIKEQAVGHDMTMTTVFAEMRAMAEAIRELAARPIVIAPPEPVKTVKRILRDEDGRMIGLEEY